MQIRTKKDLVAMLVKRDHITQAEAKQAVLSAIRAERVSNENKLQS